MNEWILSEQTHQFVSSQKWEVVVLPFGATEPHNWHMPYGTDNYQVDAIGSRACQSAYERGAKVLLLPTIPFGVNTNHFQIPGGLPISFKPTTLLKILADVVDSLERQQVRKLVLLNGHGGNDFKPLIRELYADTAVHIFECNWFKLVSDIESTIFQNPGDHADEKETSLGLAYFPQFMKMEQAGDGVCRPTKFEALNKKWIGFSRPWHLACPDTGAGNPKLATAEKGRKLMDVMVQRIGDFLYELAQTPINETFPY